MGKSIDGVIVEAVDDKAAAQEARKGKEEKGRQDKSCSDASQVVFPHHSKWHRKGRHSQSLREKLLPPKQLKNRLITSNNRIIPIDNQ
jgi:hypothetical protein